MVAGGLAITCLAVNFVVQWRVPHTVDFSSEAGHVSQALLRGRGFADPYLTGPSGATAQMAPIYPFVHALICCICGTGELGWAVIIAVTSLVWAAQWALVYRFAVFYGQQAPGIAAALIGVVLPLPGRMFKWEGVFTGAAIAFGAWLVSQIIAGKGRKSTGFQLGGWLAVGVLLCPATVLIWPAWALLILTKLGWKRSRLILCSAMFTALLPVSVWTARNYVVFGHFVWVRDNLGMELGLSNNDCATALISRNRSCFAAWHPSDNPALLRQLISEGEYQFNADAMHRMISWARSHPSRFTVLSAQRAAFFWFPIDNENRVTLIYGWVLSCFTIFGLLALMWVRNEGFWVLTSALLPFSFTYYFVQLEQRYIYPVLWITLLLACIGIRCGFLRWGPLSMRRLRGMGKGPGQGRNRRFYPKYGSGVTYRAGAIV